MNSISALIFSRGYVPNTLDLVKDVYDIVDEVVLMDMSGKQDTAELEKGKRSMGLDKLKLFHVPPIGYPDPLRMYGLKKCTGRWILYIDTDERISDGLKRDLRQIISDRRINAYAISRYEEVHDPKRLPLFATWQIRLFRKGSVSFTGLPHEQAEVNGGLGRLDRKKHFMMHLSALMTRKTQLDYMEIEKFERITYGMYNQKVLGYISKLFSYQDRDASKTLPGKISVALVKAYQWSTFKKKDQELTGFDYFFYYATLDLVYYTLEGNIKGIFRIIPKELEHVRQIEVWQRETDSKDVLEISKIINRIGITKFLNLDNEKVIDKISKIRGEGAKLLIKLIKDRYKEMSNSRD